MKKRLYASLLLCFIWFLGLSQSSYFQLNENMKDSLYFNKISKYNDNYQVDSLILIASEAFEFYTHREAYNQGLYLVISALTIPTETSKRVEVITLLQEILETYRAHSDTINMHYAFAKELIAFGLRMERQLDKSLEIYLSIDEILQKANADESLFLGIYQSIGTIYIEFSKIFEGYSYHQKALDGFIKIKDFENIAYSYLEIGNAMMRINQIEMAIVFFTKAYDILEEKDPKSYNRIVTANNLAICYYESSENKPALKFSLLADSLIHTYGYEQDLAFNYIAILSLRANIFNSLKAFDQTLETLRLLELKTKEYLGEHEIILAIIYNQFSEFYQKTANPDSSLYYLKLSDSYNPDYQINKQQLAFIESERGNYEESIKLFRNLMLANVNTDAGYDHNNVVPKVEDFTILHTNEYETVYGFDQLDLIWSLGSCYYDLYKQSSDTSNLYKAFAYYNLIDSLHSIFKQATIIGTNDINDAENYYNNITSVVYACIEAIKQTNDSVYYDYLLKFLNKSLALNLNIETKQTAFTDENKKLFQQQLLLEKQILKLSNTLNNKALFNDSVIAITEEQLLRKRLKAFEVSFELQRSLKKPDNYVQAEKLTLKNVQQLLNSDEGLLVTQNFDDNMLCLFINKSSVQIKTLAIDNTFNSLLRKHYRDIKTGNPDFEANGYEIYKRLFNDFDTELKQLKKIVVIPGQNMAEIPFETLSDGRGLWIDNYELSVNYSLELWLKAHENGQRQKNISFAGIAPVFSSDNNQIDSLSPLSYNTDIERDNPGVTDGLQLNPLIASEKEVSTIAKMFKKEKLIANTFVHEEANEKNVEKSLTNFAIVHIATHGLTNINNTNLTGLFLSHELNNNNIFADGVLYLNEIKTINNVTSDLVVLSACKTGTGKIVKGEGVMALPRGFIYAGVPNVIASLWKVHDEKTKELMVAFYKHLLEDKVSYAEALRLAKLDCIKKGFLPMDWAGFVLIGN